ncbi:MAG: NnrU family protein [Parvularculaceae bacterium]
MAIFVLGLIIFFVPHLATAFARGARGKVVKALGAGPYKGTYSLVSAIGLGLIIWGWGRADATVLFVAPALALHVVYLLTLLALIALASAYLPKGRIAAALKHPMLAGVKLWALAHLIVNGDVRSLILFGSFLAYGVLDRIAVKLRNAPTPTAGPVVNDLYAVGVGAAVWAAIYFVLHPYIAGVPIPR